MIFPKSTTITIAGLAAVLLVGSSTAQVANPLNCDLAVDIVRDDVVITDIVFNASDIAVVDESNFAIDLRYFAEQVIPYNIRSSVYFWATGIAGSTWDDVDADRDDCGFQFEFGSGAVDISPHSSAFQMPKKCFETQSTPNTLTYYTDLEYYYCIGTDSTCDRVDAVSLAWDPLARDSLRDDAYCTKLTYRLQISVSSDNLDTVVKFVLEYIRDAVDPQDQFVSFNGQPVALLEDPMWAICDKDDIGNWDMPACHLRVSPTPELRVLSLTTDKVTNEFALAFALGSSDYGLVDNDHPLTINVTRSEMWLFHALYSGTTYDNCDGDQCTKVTGEAQMNADEFGVDAHIENNYRVSVAGTMPTFQEGSGPTDMRCDESFCTMVWVINFKAKDGVQQRRILRPQRFRTVPSGADTHDAMFTPRRRLQDGEESKGKPATQQRLAKVTVGDGGDVVDVAELPENGKPKPPTPALPVIPLAGGGGAVLVVGFLVARRRRNNKQEMEEQSKEASDTSITSDSEVESDMATV